MNETRELLMSVIAASELPGEVIVCEDFSPDRSALREMVQSLVPAFDAKGVDLVWHENEVNLGFDANLREIIRCATGSHVMLVGNDDVVLAPGIGKIVEFFREYPRAKFASCAYRQFGGNLGMPAHTSKYYENDVLVTDRAGDIFRLSSFISGVVVNREWAVSLETDRFDGGLYYQVYLAASAYVDGGVGYVSSVLIGNRRGGVPLFGAAGTEKKDHVPGRIAARGRTTMYRSVLDIARYVDETRGTSITALVCRELDSRQLFHVYEDFVKRPRGETLELFLSLREIGMGKSAIHKLMFATAWTGGPLAVWLFRKARKLRESR